MPNSQLVALLYDALDDVDRAFADLSEEQATTRFRGGSAYAWTYAHLAHQVDDYVNVRAQGREPHPIFSSDFEFQGSGDAPGWSEIQDAGASVREAARSFLDPLSDEQLKGLSIRSRTSGNDRSLESYLCRIIAHQWFHTGEVATKRDMQGNRTGEYPGRLANFMAATGEGTVEQADPNGPIFVRFLEDAWDDSDRAFDGLSDADAAAPHFEGSPFGWTLAHFTGQMNMFASVLLDRGEQPAIFEHPTINEPVPMSVEDWKTVRQTVVEVREDIGDFLRGLSPGELATMTVPATSRTPEVHLKYMLGRFIGHAYFHIGEVASKRDMLGHDAGDYPGAMRHSLGR